MLIGLKIKDILLIEEAELELDEGLTVITGETGAGKSILLCALQLSLGERAENGLVRVGALQGQVTAMFDIAGNKHAKKALSELEIEAEDELIIRRVLTKDGKSKAYMNDTPVSLAAVKQVAETLIEIHSQHEQQLVASSSNHLKLLDDFALKATHEEKIAASFAQLKLARKNLQDARDTTAKSKAEEDYLRFVYDELKKLNIKAGEEAELAEKRANLSGRKKNMEAISEALSLLREGNALDAVYGSQKAMMRLLAKSEDAQLNCIYAHLEKAGQEIMDAEAKLEAIVSGGESEENLEALEDRLYAIRAAARKHNMSADELPLYTEKVKNQIDVIENSEEKIAELQQQVESARTAFVKDAKEVSEIRKKAALALEKSIVKELAALKMEKTVFKIRLELMDENSWNESGMDDVSFLASINPGQPLLPVSKIASGGELSRLMLALKATLSNARQLATMIFDEIDTGISGAVSDAVGQRLRRLAQGAQVLCVTHQPQVAASGSSHFHIFKKVVKGAAITAVKKLDADERKEEIARMLAGTKVTDEARAAAAKLIRAEAA